MNGVRGFFEKKPGKKLYIVEYGMDFVCAGLGFGYIAGASRCIGENTAIVRDILSVAFVPVLLWNLAPYLRDQPKLQHLIHVLHMGFIQLGQGGIREQVDAAVLCGRRL